MGLYEPSRYSTYIVAYGEIAGNPYYFQYPFDAVVTA
jgi:hypothetical protein